MKTYVLKASALAKLWLCSLLVCEQDNLVSWKALVLYFKVTIMGFDGDGE